VGDQLFNELETLQLRRRAPDRHRAQARGGARSSDD
jgi:hypothetical protein